MFRGSFLLIGAFIASACGGRVCQPDRCGSGRVCGLAGVCEPAPLVPANEESLEIVEEDAPLAQAYEAGLRVWGTAAGETDEVPLGGDGGSTLYMAFDLRRGPIESAVLELHPAADATYGAVQAVEVWAVEPFDVIDAGRLPGARSRGIARRTVWQPALRFDITALAKTAEGVVFIAIRARGDAPGWRLATSGAGDPSLRPRLVVHESPAAE